MKHLPTPWTLNNRKENLVSNGKVVAVWGFSLSWTSRSEETEANAKFIVKAVNNHYQLLESLKECADLISNEVADGEYTSQFITAKKVIDEGLK